MELDQIKELAIYLSGVNSDVEIYPQYGKLTILRNIGKIPGECDAQYVDFLCFSNGLKAYDCVFYGFKSKELRPYMHENIGDLWVMDCMLAGTFWGFGSSSSGYNFGYVKKKDTQGNHYIGFYDMSYPQEVTLIASSFNIFMWKFLSGVKVAVKESTDIPILDAAWFHGIGESYYHDEELFSSEEARSDFRYEL